MEMKPGERWSTKETGCNRRVESQIQSIKSKNKNKVSMISIFYRRVNRQIGTRNGKHRSK
jgi:hypothetical protein